jgi:hypothetical protein
LLLIHFSCVISFNFKILALFLALESKSFLEFSDLVFNHFIVINSDEHYLDLYKFIIPLQDRLELCSREINIFDNEVIPNLYEQYPHEIIQQVFDKAKVLPKTIENFKIDIKSIISSEWYKVATAPVNKLLNLFPL